MGVESVYRRIGELYALNYAAIGAGIGKKKPPKCKKGWECGYSCQGKDKKKCPSTVGGQAKTYADWLSKQAGGAIVPVKTGLQKTASEAEAPKPKTPRKLGPTETIDQKYAKANPTDEDIDNWLKERLNYATSVEGMAISQYIRNVFDSRVFAPEYAKMADSREDVIKAGARYRTERFKELLKKGPLRPEMYGYPSEADIKKAEDKLNSPRTKNKAKAQKELDKLKADREAGWRVANRQIEESKKTEEQRREDADRQIKYLETQVAKNSKKIQDAIAKGDVDTIQSETEKILRMYPGYKNGSEDITVLDTRKRHQEMAREYLIAKSKDRRPEDVLNIDGEITPASVKAAYRKAAVKSHPDKGGSREEFEAVSEAYKKLQEKLNFSDPPLELDDNFDDFDEDEY